MRRSDKQIKDIQLIEEILKHNTVCRIALVDRNTPYIIPMNYGYHANCIYLHSATAGRKLKIIQNNPNVCVEVEDSVEILKSEKACDFGTKYRSVICNGFIDSLKTSQEKLRGLKIILQQHTGSFDWEIPENQLKGIHVMKIEITEMTGKISGFKKDHSE